MHTTLNGHGVCCFILPAVAVGAGAALLEGGNKVSKAEDSIAQGAADQTDQAIAKAGKQVAHPKWCRSSYIHFLNDM